jgi:hypothetical protein
MPTIQEKLDRGLDQLAKADNNSDALGLSLQTIHAALEDYFRDLLSRNSSVPTEMRNRIGDRGEVKWKEILDLMQRYEGLGQSERTLISRMNSLRNPIAHGEPFTGTRQQVEEYTEYVKRTIKLEVSSNYAKSTNQQSASNDGSSSSSTQSDQFNIPANLVKFQWAALPFLISTSAIFDCINGQILRTKERTINTIINNITIHTLEQKFWFKSKDSKEEYIEIFNFEIPAREGHSVIFLFASCGKKRRCVAVYIHELSRYYYNTNAWVELLRGLNFFPGVILFGLIYYVIALGVSLTFFLMTLLGKSFVGGFLGVLAVLLFSTLLLLVIPGMLYRALSNFMCDKFKLHIGRIFSQQL